MDILPGLHEDVLEQVVGVVVRENHLSDLPVEGFGVCIDEHLESLVGLRGSLQVSDKLFLVDWRSIRSHNRMWRTYAT